MWKLIFNFVLKATVKSLAKEILKADKKAVTADKAEVQTKIVKEHIVAKKIADEAQLEKLKSLL